MCAQKRATRQVPGGTTRVGPGLTFFFFKEPKKKEIKKNIALARPNTSKGTSLPNPFVDLCSAAKTSKFRSKVTLCGWTRAKTDFTMRVVAGRHPTILMCTACNSRIARFRWQDQTGSPQERELVDARMSRVSEVSKECCQCGDSIKTRVSKVKFAQDEKSSRQPICSVHFHKHI